MQVQMMFPHQLVRKPPAGLASSFAGVEVWKVTTAAGKTDAWFFVGDGTSAENPGPAVLFAHGNGEVIEDWPEALQGFVAMGLSLLIVEYRGYGHSSGRPSIEGIQEDCVAFYDRLVAHDAVDASRVVFMGRSIGGGVVCHLAEERKPAAFVLMSTFSDLAAMAKGMHLPKFLVDNVYNNKDVIAKLALPTLLIHGKTDTLIPVGHADTLEAAATGPFMKVLYPGAHNDTPTDWQDFYRNAEAFFRTYQIL